MNTKQMSAVLISMSLLSLLFSGSVIASNLVASPELINTTSVSYTHLTLPTKA